MIAAALGILGAGSAIGLVLVLGGYALTNRAGRHL